MAILYVKHGLFGIITCPDDGQMAATLKPEAQPRTSYVSQVDTTHASREPTGCCNDSCLPRRWKADTIHGDISVQASYYSVQYDLC